MNYFFAGQLRQYRLQFIRAFSNFYVNFGSESAPDLRRVPCRYGDPSRIAETVVRGNSENKVLSTPFISCIVKDITMASNRRQDPLLVDKVQVNERKYDEETGHYTQDIGNRYTVERYMPVPYDLVMQVDIWTSNTNQKEELLEQIFMLYNPAIEFQTSNNPLDWTLLSYIEMQESITWSSRSIPVGTENPIDVLTLSFKVPIWINPPAKVKRQSIIHEIITDVIQGSKGEYDWEWSEYEFLSRTITTPGNYSIGLEYTGDNTYDIRLLTEGGGLEDPNHYPTVAKSIPFPKLIPGTRLVFNGVTIPIDTSNVSTFVDNCQLLLGNTTLAVQMHNKNSIWFINNTGSDITLSNDIGTPLQNMGLENSTYPGGNLAWWRLFEPYGEFNDYVEFGSNASQLRIKQLSDIEDNSEDVVGWMSLHPTDQNRIIWKIDSQSLPGMTLSSINAIIDPLAKGPGNGLPAALIGQRYLLTNKIAEQSLIWGSVDANINDIIEFNGSEWTVVFNASLETYNTHYLTNLFSGKIYKWADSEWFIYIESKYRKGYWRISL
jgi:hypothetical protein